MAFEMIPVGAVQSAANYLENEWGEDRTMGEGRRSERRWDLYIFECGASDGSRWFIIADRWGNVAHADTAADAPAAFLERYDSAH